MPRYCADITSHWPPARALDYMADFANAVHWDPSVASARMTSAQPVRTGSTFRLDIRRGSRILQLDYTITELGSLGVRLQATTTSLISTDTIRVLPRGAACAVCYEAQLSFRGWRRLANPLLAVLFRQLGNRARAGLERQLNT